MPLNVRQIRLQNLNDLIVEAGSIDQLANRCELNVEYLKQITFGWNGRNVGDAAARKIEVGMRRPFGWLDHDHREQPESESAIRRRLDVLDTALHRYGRHDDDCDRSPCSCGFRAALKWKAQRSS
jgi:hypothetical protein